MTWHRLGLLRGVGQVVLPCRSGMPESLLLFSPEVSAWGSYLLCSQEVQESKSPEVGDRKSLCKNSLHMSFRGAAGDEEPRSGPGSIQGEIPRCARNDTLNQVFAEAPRGLPSSDEEGLGVVGLCILRAHFAFACNWVSDIEKWRNKARMFMKTKDRPANQPPLIQGGESSRLAPLLGSGGVGGGATLRPLRALRLGVKPDI